MYLKLCLNETNYLFQIVFKRQFIIYYFKYLHISLIRVSSPIEVHNYYIIILSHYCFLVVSRLATRRGQLRRPRSLETRTVSHIICARVAVCDLEHGNAYCSLLEKRHAMWTESIVGSLLLTPRLNGLALNEATISSLCRCANDSKKFLRFLQYYEFRNARCFMGSK